MGRRDYRLRAGKSRYFSLGQRETEGRQGMAEQGKCPIRVRDSASVTPKYRSRGRSRACEGVPTTGPDANGNSYCNEHEMYYDPGYGLEEKGESR